MNVLLTTEWKQALIVSLYIAKLRCEQEKNAVGRAVDSVTVTHKHNGAAVLPLARRSLAMLSAAHNSVYRSRYRHHRTNPVAHVWTWTDWLDLQYTSVAHLLANDDGAAAVDSFFHMACVDRMRYLAYVECVLQHICSRFAQHYKIDVFFFFLVNSRLVGCVVFLWEHSKKSEWRISCVFCLDFMQETLECNALCKSASNDE